MKENPMPVPVWCKALILVLLALTLTAGCVALEKAAEIRELEENAHRVCGSAMVAIELELRADEPVESDDLQAFYTITQLYPDSSYAQLSQLLLALEDPERGLTEQERLVIADGIRAFYREEDETVRAEHFKAMEQILAIP